MICWAEFTSLRILVSNPIALVMTSLLPVFLSSTALMFEFDLAPGGFAFDTVL